MEAREIMWNIPHEMKILMYSLFVISVAVMAKGVYDKIQLVTKGKGVGALAEILPEQLNWKKFFHTILFTGKVPRFKEVAFFHGLIFYGFFILWVATDLVAIHYDTPLKVFQGTTYIVVSFLADIAGIMVLVGLAFAFRRRYVTKPAHLSATKPNQELFMYRILASLVIIGYLIEGLRISGTGMPVSEMHWSPSWLGYCALFYEIKS